MPEFWNEFHKLNIETGLLWWVLGVIALALLIKRYVSRYIARLFVKMLRRAGKKVNESRFFGLLVGPLEAFLLILVIILAIEKIRLPLMVKNYGVYDGVTVGHILRAVSVTVLIVTFIWLLLRIIDFIAHILEARASLTAGQNDDQLIVFFKDFFKVILVIVGFLLVLRFSLGYNVNNLLTGLGIMGAAIALATKESLENLIASFVIFFDKPFTTGDLVKVHDVSGTVERIGLRSTRIRTENKTFVTVPNKQMVDSIVDNQSLRTQRRGSVTLYADTGTSAASLRQLNEKIHVFLNSQLLVESHSVLLSDVQRDAYVLPVEYFTAPIDIGEFNRLKNNLNFGLIAIMEELGISLAGEQQEVVVTGGR